MLSLGGRNGRATDWNTSITAYRFFHQLSFRSGLPRLPFAPPSVTASVVATASGTADEFTSTPSSSLSGPQQPSKEAAPNKRKPFAFGTLAKRTQRLMKITDAAYIPGSDPETEARVKVTRRTFNNLIDNWAFSGHPDLIQQVGAIVQRMEDMLERNVQEAEDDEDDEDEEEAGASTEHQVTHMAKKIQPDVRTYTKAIHAIAKSGSPDAGEKAEATIAKMNALYESGINVLAKPNVYTYTGAMQAWSASGQTDAPWRAQKLLDALLKLYEETGDEELKPNVRSFNEVINAFAKSTRVKGSAQQAEQCLDTMEELYNSNNPTYADLRPNRVNFNAVIHAWANSGEEGAAERSEGLLARMERLYKEGNEEAKPNVKDFNAVIDAWSKSESEQAGQKAEQILDHMQELYEAGDIEVKPNVRSFNSAINAWAKSRAKESPEMAEALLMKMENLYESGEQDLQPDVHSFSTVINAWARSLSSGKAERAQKNFRYMLELYKAGNKKVEPNIVIYNSLMNACAYTVGDMLEQTRAMEIASETFREIEQSPFAKPDQVTYGTFLKVCATQMPEGDAKNLAVEAVFRKCCKAGQVSDLVLRQFQNTSTAEQYQKLLGKHVQDSISVEEVPEEWRRNVRERRTHSYNSSLRRRSMT